MRRTVLGALALSVALVTMLGSAGAASAACDSVTGTVGVSTTFTYCATPAMQTYTAPMGVSRIRVVAIGARGGDAFGFGGLGGRVESIVLMPPGLSTVNVVVGGTGEQGSYNGGGLSSGSGPSAGGGGASDVRYGSGYSSRMVVAGGGGGAGPCGTRGGAGGGGTDGNGNDGDICAFDTAQPAKGGTQTAGGAGANGAGGATDGTFGEGGAGGDGGGGGGGWYGGGGNATGTTRSGGGGSSYSMASATFSTTGDAARVTITPYLATTTTVTGSGSPSKYGQSVTFTATVSNTAATGTVQFYDGATAIGGPRTVTSGQATLTTSALSVASHDITAVYSGDTGFAPSTSAGHTQVVDKATTMTTLSSSANPSTYGSSVTLTATVTPGSGTLDGGTVQFSDGGTNIGAPVAVNTSTGKASITTSSLSSGAHSLKADYSGNTNFNASNGSLTQNVAKSATTTALTTATSPSKYGEDATLTAVVTPAGGTLDAGSTVQFSDGGTALGAPVPVDTATGKAELTTSALDVGSHSLKASFGGNANLAASDGSVTHVVDKADAAVAVVAGANPTTYAKPVTFTATVTPGSGALNSEGTVQFYDGADPLGAAQPVDASNEASVTASSLGGGAHTITARYSGGAHFNGDNSAALAHSIDKAATATAVTTPAAATYGDSVTLRATVSSADATADGGTLQFYDGADPVGGARPVGADGKAEYTPTAPLGGGDHAITARYSGDTDFAPSDSAAVTQAIARAATTTVLTTSPTTATAGQRIALVAAVGSGVGLPDGEVTFRDGDTVLGTAPVASDGRARLNTAALTSGPHRFTATYGGAGNHAPSSSNAVDLTVTNAPSGEPEIVTRVALSHRVVQLRGGKIRVALRCRAATGRSCTGKVSLRVTSDSSRLKAAAVGRANYTIGAGKSKTLKITPPKSIAKLFARRRKAVVEVTIAQTGGDTIKKKITVVAR